MFILLPRSSAYPIVIILLRYSLNDGDNNNIINVISTAQKVSRVWSNQSYFTTILRN